MRCPPPLTLTSVVAAAAMFVAGCGGGSSPGVANVSSATSTSSSTSGGPPTEAQIRQAQQDAVRFVNCMRSHGVPNLPYPTTAPRAFKNELADKSPALQSAYTTCAHLLPAGGPSTQNTASTQAHIAALLAFARCLRSHGYPSFPDPTGSGQVTHQMLANAGIDLHQAALVRAADACTSVTYGVITKAVVAHFVAGQ